MPAWASIERDPTWLARLKAPVLYPATLVYLDWPGAEVRASTHNKALMLLGATWTGVGELAFIKPGQFNRDNALVRYTVGLSSLPQDQVDPDMEQQAIGRRAIMYLALFDKGWVDPVAESVFTGHVRTTGEFKTRDVKQDDGTVRKVVDASIEIANGRNPRRSVKLYHSVATAAPGDTAWRLAHTAGKRFKWPA